MRRESTAARVRRQGTGAANERAADRVKRWIRFWSVSCWHPGSHRAPHRGDLVLDMSPILGITVTIRCIDSNRP
ncbi:hypothetical protein B7G54_20535 [Burkholderia puraquae]|uniref:Uncharacterized protein n=1 Tax=Burkholderia puraquae TaxID=1904757 RepID=A0A1X1PEP9_9BURK|nr:hypothetical protein B7G54_20535 [Burkholderia puraquae]